MESIYEKLCDRLDALESRICSALQESRADMLVNTTELRTLSARVQNTCRPGISSNSEPQIVSEELIADAPSSGCGVAPHAAQQDQKVTAPHVLLRRLKRGCLLQYERDDDDSNDSDDIGANAATENVFQRFNRQVCCPCKSFPTHCKSNPFRHQNSMSRKSINAARILLGCW